MTDNSKPKCCHTHMRDYHNVRCNKNASVEEGGKHYCKVHAPSIRRARDDKRYEGWQKKWEQQALDRKQEKLERLIGQEVLRRAKLGDGLGADCANVIAWARAEVEK